MGRGVDIACQVWMQPSSATPVTPVEPQAPAHLNAAEFAELDAMLNALRSQFPATPGWEFCEGFMAALICCRRPIAITEYLPVLFATAPTPAPALGAADGGLFGDAVPYQRFMGLWTRRWSTVLRALDTKVVALDDPAAYQPEVVDAPHFGQQWALGFMAVVRAWPQDWTGLRNRQAIQWSTAAISVVDALTGNDVDPPTLHAFEGDTAGPPTVSPRRMQAFGDAIWAVYNMRETWRTLGPRVETVHKAATPGRNDTCPCGSGRKYKKCCALLSIA